MTSRDQSQGCLFYIIGASGVGKDSLIHAVCELARSEDSLCIAPRHITRPASELDKHIELSQSKFRQRLDAGDFLFHWSAHGFDYGVGAEVRDWVVSGRRVLIDGSRAYLEQARQIYPALRAIGIEADSGCLPARLRQRGREDEQAISERLSRNAEFASSLRTVDTHIENNQGIEQAAKALLSVIRGCD